MWCVLKPGLLLLYKSDKLKVNSKTAVVSTAGPLTAVADAGRLGPQDWVGTVLLSTCKLMERPSKKDGFCFKLFHPLDQSIWAPKGPQGETIRECSPPSLRASRRLDSNFTRALHR